MLVAKATTKSLSPRQEIKSERYTFMNDLTTVYILHYLLWRHRVFLLSAGYPMAFTLYLVLHYR